MDKFKEIRPIALGLAIKNNKLLVSEGFDKVKNETFYRCLGGGIEFLEKSEEALKREFLEEINVDITVKNFLGISENIFTYQGKKAHELILFYSIEISDENYQEEYKVIDDHGETIAKWIDIDEFKNKNKILYPKEVFKYI
ncbi:MAG: NUDIX hydrolase [Clostridiales bacterium]|nr:nUDIX hydrolase [Clostridium sp. CAG:567]